MIFIWNERIEGG